MRRQKARPHVCTGGPYDGKTLMLASAGTLTFSLGFWFGHYDSDMFWVDDWRRTTPLPSDEDAQLSESP